MSNLITFNNEPTMSSLELLEIINESRSKAGESVVRRNQFHERVVDELEGEHYKKNVVQNLNNTESVVFELTKDQCTLVAMRESKAVRRSVLERLKSLEARPQSLEEITLVQSQLLVQQKQRIDSLERNATVQTQEHERLAAKVTQIEKITQNGVPVGYIAKSKAHKIYSRGLSKEVFEQALTVLNVKTEKYVHTENDHSVYTFAWKESEIKSAIGYFIENSIQTSAQTCSSRILNGKKFRFIKEKSA